MGIALGQEQYALPIGHPLAVELAPFVRLRGVGELARIFSIYPGEPQVALASVCRGICHPDQDSLAVGGETGIAHGPESSQLLVAGKAGWSRRLQRTEWKNGKH